MITAERLRQALSYDPETGRFVWRVDSGRARAGTPAGSRRDMRTEGKYRISVSIDGRRYFAHRLAWLYVFGQWPTMDIDHIDGDSENNRIANLREATKELNAQNRRAAGGRSTSGLLGVLRIRQGHRTYWQAKIMARGVSHYLGCYSRPEDAHEAYLAAKRNLHAGCLP